MVSKIEDPNETLPVGYTKNQLQVVQDNEQLPDKSIIREEIVPEPRKTRAEREAERKTQQVQQIQEEKPKERGTLERITRRYKSGNKILFNVKLTGIKELQTYTRQDLLQIAPDLVKQYENKK